MRRATVCKTIVKIRRKLILKMTREPTALPRFDVGTFWESLPRSITPNERLDF